MVDNNYQWVNERGNTKNHACMNELDTLNMLSAKMDNVVKMQNRQGEVGPTSNSNVARCTLCGENHESTNCVTIAQEQYVNNFNWLNQKNPYSNTYNQQWRNHPNVGRRDQGNQQRSINPPDFQSKQALIESKLS